MPQFNDSENKLMLVPEGDYIFCVIDAACKLQQKGKTVGSDVLQLELEIEPAGSHAWENLIDHPSCAWKIDTFVKSAGIKLTKGEAFEFRQDAAEQRGVTWVNPLGLRGWCKLSVEEYPLNSGKKRNHVACFYTDKPKLPARVIAQPEEADKPF